jgi:MFS family permease
VTARSDPDGDAPGLPASRSSTFAALGVRDYRLYWIGLVSYVLGHRAEYVTFAWLTWELTRDPLYLGYLGLAQGVPLALLQLWGGVLADRVDRLRLLLATQLGTGATLGLAFALAVAGTIRVEVLLALAAVAAVFRAFDEPTRMALVPQLVPRERLANAIALGAIPWQASRVIGPSLTGILIAAAGGAVGLGLAAGASFVALALYGRLRVPRLAPGAAEARPAHQLLEGVRFVVHDFVFATLISLALFNAIFGLSYLNLLPIYADLYFGAGSAGFGLLNGAHGVGALIGILGIANLAPHIRRPGTTLLGLAAAMGLGLTVFSASTSLGVALAVLAGVGFCNTFYLIQVQTFLQANVPDHLLGRVMSIYSLCWNLLPLGGLLGGALAAAVSARFAVRLGGALVTANALVLLSSRRLRAIR